MDRWMDAWMDEWHADSMIKYSINNVSSSGKYKGFFLTSNKTQPAERLYEKFSFRDIGKKIMLMDY